MCGRTACTRAPGEIADACSYRSNGGKTSKPQWKSAGGNAYNPSYNKGPKSCSPILLKNKFFSSENEDLSERILLPMQWGLVPSWHKGDPKKFSFNMINCRCDTLTEKKSFMNALEKGQRCIVLADGFYEWKVNGKEKQPYYIQLKGSDKLPAESKPMLSMAGLFDKQISEEGELYTYTVITVDASSSVQWLHHRMPAILDSEDDISQWLNVDTIPWKKALDLLKPKNCLEWYPVSSVVNNVRNNTEDCVKKIDLVKEAAKKARSGQLMSAWLKKGEKRKSSEVNEDETEKKKLSK
ncbi:abasic site processing protein HMCES-like [Hydractinia symbiolongicarpus]|uniref:abasic site processing protein HMCES-like n=1 Tax=Hydractinia symbiolongicarpus TaxID=13093 RepID=UPI00254C4A01|nr:abasic site processing protein HMCES-like [Hydractinia symbiolongicarpus]